MESMFLKDKKSGKKPVVKKVAKNAEGKIPVSIEAIQKKAYELYEKRGGKKGNAEQDWLEAKRLLEADE